MFGLGAIEIGLILVVALIVIGPKKLPELAGQVARAVRELQRTATEFSREITTPVSEIRRDLVKTTHTIATEIANADSEQVHDPNKNTAPGDNSIEPSDAGLDHDPDDGHDAHGVYHGDTSTDSEYPIDAESAMHAHAARESDPEPNVVIPADAETSEAMDDLPVVRSVPGAVAYRATPPASVSRPPQSAVEGSEGRSEPRALDNEGES